MKALPEKSRMASRSNLSDLGSPSTAPGLRLIGEEDEQPGEHKYGVKQRVDLNYQFYRLFAFANKGTGVIFASPTKGNMPPLHVRGVVYTVTLRV